MEAVATDTEMFKEKLNALLKGRVKAEYAEKAGLQPQAMQRYLDGAAPRPFSALRLAEALGVDVRWLIDERQTSLTPPAKIDVPAIKNFSDKDLITELTKRYIVEAKRLSDAMDAAFEMDWVTAAIHAWRMPFDGLPTGVDGEYRVIREIAGRIAMLQSWPDVSAHLSAVRGAVPDFDIEKLKASELEARWTQFAKDEPAFKLFFQNMVVREAFNTLPKAAQQKVEASAPKMLAEARAILGGDGKTWDEMGQIGDANASKVVRERNAKK